MSFWFGETSTRVSRREKPQISGKKIKNKKLVSNSTKNQPYSDT